MRNTSPLQQGRRLITTPVPFVLGWRNMALLGAGLGALNVLMTLIFEPWGTSEWDAPWRILRLSGYAVVYVGAFVGVHALDRVVYRRQGYRWWVADEVVMRTVLFLAVTTGTWFYNSTVINDITPSVSWWVDYLVHFSLPNLPILLPVAILGAVLLGTRFPEDPPDPVTRLQIRGQGSDESLAIPLSCFRYAEAQQNYVAIHFVEEGRVQKVLFRMTLGELEEQVEGSIRIHRSFLIHPTAITAVIDDARKPQVVVEGVDEPLPVSRGFDLAAVGR